MVAPVPTADVETRRLSLFSTRMRFSPQTQAIRQTAIDKILEQNLAIADGAAITVQQIQEQGFVCFVNGGAAIGRLDIEQALHRLEAAGRVISEEGIRGKKYRLTDKVRTEIFQAQRVSDERVATIVNKLFKGLQGGAAQFTKPFLECLCRIFSQLGEAYVRHMKHELTSKEMLDQPYVARAFEHIKKSYPFINEQQFQTAVYTFFQSQDPSYVALKWNLAQNYYIAKSLGLDPHGRIFSKELFGNAAFYLDTNVLIEALEQRGQHYASFGTLARACKDLEISLQACQISIDEVRKVTSFERVAIEKVLDKIPEETATNVKGVLYPIYLEQRMEGKFVSFDELFSAFVDPSKQLADKYGVELVDDKWFVSQVDEPETQKWAEAIRKVYADKPGRHKTENASIHDALLLRWVEKERTTNKQETWVVTLDHSLPMFDSDSPTGKKPLAVRLDALLHWISPIALRTDEEEDRVAAIFSEALKHNLLPQDTFFEMGDFLAFAEWEWDSKELPAKDVEDCIRTVRAAAPHLNPTRAEDREKMAREFAKFFADPSRKFKQELQHLEDKNAEITKEMQAVVAARDSEVQAFGAEGSNLREQIRTLEASLKEERLRSSAHARLVAVAIFWVIAEFAVGILTMKYGAGENAYQKLTGGWEQFLGTFALFGVISLFVLGRDRVRALGFPFNRLINGSE